MDDSTERRTSRKVVFSRPFTIGSSAEVYPAGTYEVETAEAIFEGVEHIAHVRTSTVLIIPTASGTCDRKVLGKELDEALKRDSELGDESLSGTDSFADGTQERI
jgi:hypothetical protein